MGQQRKEITASDRLDAIDRLGHILRENDSIYCILRWVNRVGDNRIIDFYAARCSPSESESRAMLFWISGLIEKALTSSDGSRPYTYTDRHNGGLLAGGSGADMGLAVVYDLSRVLFGDGYKLKRVWI